MQAGGPEDVISTILGGMTANGPYAMMPGIGAQMTDQQVADAANYVRTAWSNHAPPNAEAGMVGNLRAKTDTMMAGGTCGPVDPVLQDAKSGFPATLEGVNEGNLLQRVDVIVAKAKQVMPKADRATLVNNIVSAYCPVLKADTSVTASAKEQQLGSFAGLVYGQINPAPSGQK